MLLEAGGETRFKVRPVEGLDPSNIKPDSAEKLILDGQQHLTSLTQVLMLDKAVETRTATRKPLQRYYYIDIETALLGPEHYENAFIGIGADRQIRENFGRSVKLDLSSADKEYENFYFPCNQILNSDQWEKGLANFNQDKFFRYMNFRELVLAEFRNYDVPIIALSKENKKEAVCLVFEKVNTGGVPLSVFELLTATYAADDTNLRDEWYGNEQKKKTGIRQFLVRQRLLRAVQPNEFLQGLTLLYTWEKRQADLAAGLTGKQVTGISAKREAVLSLPLSAFHKWQDRLANGFARAAKFLRKESFFSTHELPYSTQLVPLAAVMTLLGDDWLQPLIYDRIARWYWCGVLGELYGGAVETRMALDLQGLMAWIRDDADEPTTIRDASFQPARLDSLRSRNSAAYKGINVLIQRDGAKDFFWKSTIHELDETDWEECKLDIHHIFPKKWCQLQRISSSRYNSILNKTPISYKANRMIGGDAPSLYLSKLQNHKHVQLSNDGMDAILKTHCIAPELMRSDNFDEFMTDRKKALLAKISAVMGKSIVISDEPVAEDVSDEEVEDE